MFISLVTIASHKLYFYTMNHLLKSLFASICFCFFCIMLRAGNADTINVYSSAMHKDIPCVVITPNGYKKTSKKYPVLYLLHGYAGNYKRWLLVAPQLKNKADEMQLIIVCPDGGYGSWYVDSPEDSAVRYETFTAIELVQHIDSVYKTRPIRSQRAISGLSMGGHGALYLAIRHREIFGAAGSMSGLVDLSFFPRGMNFNQLFGDSTVFAENLKNNSVINVVDSLKNRELKLTIDCGIYDFLIIPNRALHQKLLKLRIEHDYAERPGIHNAVYWKNSIDYQLLFFRKFFDAAKSISRAAMHGV
ncbi:MAG: alpha/beta hydrolase family protein [Chitinophagaceae bacterium]